MGIANNLFDEIKETIKDPKKEAPKNKMRSPMKFVYADVKQEDIKSDVEYPVFMEWDKHHKCTVHIHATDEAARAHGEQFKETNCPVFPLKSRVARLMFIEKDSHYGHS